MGSIQIACIFIFFRISLKTPIWPRSSVPTRLCRGPYGFFCRTLSRSYTREPRTPCSTLTKTPTSNMREPSRAAPRDRGPEPSSTHWEPRTHLDAPVEPAKGFKSCLCEREKKIFQDTPPFASLRGVSCAAAPRCSGLRPRIDFEKRVRCEFFYERVHSSQVSDDLESSNVRAVSAALSRTLRRDQNRKRHRGPLPRTRDSRHVGTLVSRQPL